jgi:hypothetical protein
MYVCRFPVDVGSFGIAKVGRLYTAVCSGSERWRRFSGWEVSGRAQACGEGATRQ